MTETSVAELADLVGGRLVGDGERRITGLGDLRTAGPDRIGFVRGSRYHAAAATTGAGALLTSERLTTPAAQILVNDVDLAYARIAAFFHPLPRAVEHTVHERAVIDPAAQLTAPVQIGPNAVIGKARIGAGCVIMAGASIGDGVTIGPDSTIHPNVTIYHDVQIGARAILHAGAVIGSDGFGYARDGATWIKVPQLGSVVIEDDVEVGAGTAIDRATLGVTRIGARTKIDNLCHIAHNCTIGRDVAMAAGCAIAGSTVIGDRVTMAGNCGVSGHLRIGDDLRLGGGTNVLRDLLDPGEYMGHPVMKKRAFLRLLRILRGMADHADERVGDE